MKVSSLRCVLTFILLAAPITALAIPPALLSHYDLIPRRSVLTKTGGFAGVNELYRLIGDYDFIQDWDYPVDPPALIPVASFANAEIWGTQILPPGVFAPAIVIDVDELLNLEGLQGELLPLGAPFDVYRFTGLINDSAAASPLEQSSIELYAALIGPWMFLYGETTQPPYYSDRFEYQIKALARRGPWADINDDGIVDSADYTLMRDATDGAVSTASVELGDATLYDFQQQFGETLPDLDSLEAMFSSMMGSASAAVPEPSSIVLVLIAAAAWRRR